MVGLANSANKKYLFPLSLEGRKNKTNQHTKKLFPAFHQEVNPDLPTYIPVCYKKWALLVGSTAFIIIFYYTAQLNLFTFLFGLFALVLLDVGFIKQIGMNHVSNMISFWIVGIFHP